MSEKTLEKNLVNNNFSDILDNRKSYRKFKKDEKISHKEMLDMINEAMRAPSACNLQAWRLIVVDTEKGRKKLASTLMPFNKPQYQTAPAMILIFGNTNAFKKYRDLWNKSYQKGNVTKEMRDAAIKTFLPVYEKASKQFLVDDAKVDGSLLAMQLMLIARAHGYETNPIAGYNADKMADTFGLDKNQYVPVMALAIGKPDQEAKSPLRYSADSLVSFQ